HLSRFVTLLQELFGWNLARAKCGAAIILGLIKVRTANLTELATAIPGHAQVDSKYKRLQRFFKEVTLDFSLVAKLIASLVPDDQWIIDIDRTTWQLGKVSINILYLAIVYQGIAIPILWVYLPKKGNSNTAERIALIDQFIAIFGVEKIACLLADREFCGQEWILYLIEKNIKFRLRIKVNTQINRRHGGFAPVKNFFQSLPINSVMPLKGTRQVWGQPLYVTGMRLVSGEYLIIIHSDPNTAVLVMEDYAKRWEIETLFKCLKSGGFNFEDTHLIDPERLEKLVAFLAITFSWAYLIGEWCHTQKPIRVKSHQRPAKSIFRYGLDWLRDILLNMIEKVEAYNDAVVLFLNRLGLSN
ncbi:MAG TPA: IS4 family transposase, partial [Saprospiraceae bacterium]|nr:IS4 family transposase [Saprospiraceae bacterium]